MGGGGVCVFIWRGVEVGLMGLLDEKGADNGA